MLTRMSKDEQHESPGWLQYFWLCISVTLLLSAIALRFFRLEHEFWFDEAAQFWIGYGQSPQANELSRGTVSQLLIYNYQHNLDGPLFSLLIFGWSAISTQLVWLRHLPVLLSVIGILLFFTLLNEFQLPRILTWSACAYFASHYYHWYFAQEFRGYALSTSLIVALLLFWIRANKDQSQKNLFFFFVIAASCLLLLYSLWLLVFILIVFALLNKKLRSTSFFSGLVFLAVTAGIIFLSQLRHQLAYGASISYLDEWKLNGFPAVTMISKGIQFNGGVIIYLLGLPSDLIRTVAQVPLILAVTLSSALVFIAMRGKTVWRRLQTEERLVIILPIILLMLTTILSVLSIFPIGPNRWNYFQSVPFFLALLLVVSKMYQSKVWLYFLTFILISSAAVSQLYILQHPRHFQPIFSTVESFPSTIVTVFSYSIFPQIKYATKELEATFQISLCRERECLNGSNDTVFIYSETEKPMVLLEELQLLAEKKKQTLRSKKHQGVTTLVFSNDRP